MIFIAGRVSYSTVSGATMVFAYGLDEKPRRTPVPPSPPSPLCVLERTGA